MPLLDIATSQPSFGSHICTSRAHFLVHSSSLRTSTFTKEKLSSIWKISIPRQVNFDAGNVNMREAFLIRAVSTLEPKHVTKSKDREEEEDHRYLFNPDSNPKIVESLSDSEVDDKEKIRRMRISNANRGNVPWNKGRKHSEETLRRIRERTRLAMQDPKVKMKLVNLGHSQTEETKKKIGVGVRIGWQRRREKMSVQETCCFEWQNLVAEASRRGFEGEEEMQWDSYKILDKQLEQEWLESIEQRKSTPRAKGNKRAPKSAEQRRKISEAISAKWNDPGYRERVCSALEKYHGTPIGKPKRKPRRNPSEDPQSVKTPVKKKVKETNYDSGNEKKTQARSKPKRTAPKYKDPLADTKLEMIKNIRAQRMSMETKKTEAMERARMLITEAEKAAKTLEEAALTSPLARASLIETRKLIAEATRSIEAVETGQVPSSVKDSYSSSKFNGQVNQYGEETDTGHDDHTQPNMKKVNGIHVPLLSNDGFKDMDFGKDTVQEVINHGRLEEEDERSPVETNGAIRFRPDQAKLPNGVKPGESKTGTTKKWVRGRLVEVSDSNSECD